MIRRLRKSFVSTKEKLVWVAPKISLMEANQTEGKTHNFHLEFFVNGTQGHGPS